MAVPPNKGGVLRAALALAFVAVVLAAVGCGRARNTSRAIPTATSPGIVTPVSRPLPPSTDRAASSLRTDLATAKPCTANDVPAAEGVRNGAGGTTIVPVDFTNVSSSPCLLEGYLTITATEPGRQSVTASEGPLLFLGPASNIAPRRAATVVLETFAECAALPGGGNPIWYSRVTVTLPAGGSLDVPLEQLDLACGLLETPFGFAGSIAATPTTTVVIPVTKPTVPPIVSTTSTPPGSPTTIPTSVTTVP